MNTYKGDCGMRVCSTAELRRKEVINLCDGSRLGFACDFEFDIDEGKILALIISGQEGFFGFGKCADIFIGWERIQCIGEDTILVKIPTGEFACCERPRKKGAWFR
ncbi:MAG: YlmC/YmxH family sporulation protein [Eubacteriales bacterium]|jgi:YlmC/YmxH family sporulation protein